MSGLFRTFGFTAIVISAFTLYVSLGQSGHPTATDPLALLDEIRHSLAVSGLRERGDVSIEMNGRAVALGFSRPGCDGLMLVAVLPHTAQGWAHIAPRLDLSTYRLGYLYDGTAYPSVPGLERLADRLRSDLRPNRTRTIPQVIAVAEAGGCDLLGTSAPALEAASLGRMSLAQHTEARTGMGEISA